MLLNEEQRILEDSVRGFIKDNAPVEQLRRLRDSSDGLGYDAQLWNQLIELGLSCAVLPEAHGGLAVGWLGMGAVMEACGAHLVASPLLATTVFGASLLELAASPEQQQRWLAPVAEGEMTLAVALDESHHFAPLMTTATLIREGEHWRLSGQKRLVIDGHSANQ